jgi:succinate dehydrogenase/fumarate reductase iron-sulfur protein
MNMLKVPLQIFRYKTGQPARYDTFTVEIADTAHVIDAIDTVWARHDSTLTFRRACHHSSCGSCALRINGVEKLPCIARITDVWNGKTPVLLEPLRNFPIVSDLVVEVGYFFERMAAAGMTITCEAEGFLPLTVDTFAVADVLPKVVELPENLSRFNRFEKCIECGICMSACPTMATDDKFLGPAALAAIYQARQKTRDPASVKHLLGLADGEHGVWRCHSAFECTESCPQAVDPASKIMALRRELAMGRLRRLFGLQKDGSAWRIAESK